MREPEVLIKYRKRGPRWCPWSKREEQSQGLMQFCWEGFWFQVITNACIIKPNPVATFAEGDVYDLSHQRAQFGHEKSKKKIL